MSAHMKLIEDHPTARSHALDPVDADEQWLKGLARRSEGGPIIADERNILRAFRTAPGLNRLTQFNDFTGHVEFTGPAPWRDYEMGDRWTDDDDTLAGAWLQAHAIPVRGRSIVADVVRVVATDRSVHPVKDRLSSLEWDGKERLKHWLKKYLVASGDTTYLAAVGTMFLISAVARIFLPGCQVDYMLVLEGPQGCGKSTAAKLLAINAAWFADSLGDLHSKDAAIQLSGKWVVELSELAAMRRAEVEQVKAFISRAADTYRPPYAKRTIDVPRQCVFIGTTNEAEYMRDKTGNRRYWPVRCGAIDLAALETDRDQLLAEAVHCYQIGTPWHPDQDVAMLATAEQQKRLLKTELEENVFEYLQQRLDLGVTEVTTKEVFCSALNLDSMNEHYAEKTNRLAVQVATAMNQAGWQRVGTMGRARTKRTVYRYAGSDLT